MRRHPARAQRLARTISVVIGLIVTIAGAMATLSDDGEPRDQASATAEPLKTSDGEPAVALPKKAYLRDACKLPPKWVKRIHRGWAPGGIRDYDLVIVPKPPN